MFIAPPSLAEEQFNKRAGVAGMKYDGTIVLRLRKETLGTQPHPGLLFCAPGDANYAQLFAYLDALMPGQTMVVNAHIEP